MSAPTGRVLPQVLPVGADLDGRLVDDLLARGPVGEGLPVVGFVVEGEAGAVAVPVEGFDGYTRDVVRLRADALRQLGRHPARWADVRDAHGAVVAVEVTGPLAAARLVEKAALKEAARLLGARELWLVLAGPERLRAVDAWRAPIADNAAQMAMLGEPVLVARDGVVTGLAGPDGATLPLPPPAGVEPEAPQEGLDAAQKKVLAFMVLLVVGSVALLVAVLSLR